MAWNRSNPQSSKINHGPSWPYGRSRCRQPNKVSLRYIFGVLIVVTLAVTYYHLCDKDSEQVQSVKKHAIPKVGTKKNKIPKGCPIHIIKKKPIVTRSINCPELTDGNPIVKQKALGRIIQWKHKDGPPLFTNRFESLVCEIMTATPGERFLDLDIDEEFEECFQESLAHQITISPDDTEDVRYMKETVINAKKEVQKLIQEGNSAREIILNARDELNKIADYRDKLQESVNEFLVTATDVKETLKFVNEANQILAEYGAMPVDGPDDEDTAYELMIHAKEEKLKKLDEEENQSQKE